MNHMSTAHKHHRFRARLQVLATNRTVHVKPIRGVTRMRFDILNRQARATTFAVMIVDTQPLSHTTNATAVAMVRLPARRVVVKFTHGAKVARKPHAATATSRGDGLHIATFDTANLLRGVSIDFVVLLVVMASAAGVEAAAAVRLDPAFALVVRAAGGGAGARKGGVGDGKGDVGLEKETTTLGVERLDTLCFGLRGEGGVGLDLAKGCLERCFSDWLRG